jgi:glycerate kinase
VATMLAATGGQARNATVTGPLGEPVEAIWAMLGGQPATAVIELASAAGLAQVPLPQRDPTRTTTFGVGRMIAQALDAGAKRVLVGIGGSATHDMGAGLAQALGVRFLDRSGHTIVEPMTGGRLGDVARIDLTELDARLRHTAIRVACDVTNPLTGPQGAAAVYGPQKGATPSTVAALDASTAHLARLLVDQHGLDIASLPGSGAAGGAGGGLVAFLGATLEPGIDLVLDAVDFEARVRGCDLCLTGEGRLDAQTLSGKACLGVARAAARHRVATIALVGTVGPGADDALQHGLHSYEVIGRGLAVSESMRRAAELLEQTAARVVQRLAACD